MKRPSQPEHPKHCPHGHKHLSWSPGDDGVYCWDCDREYEVTECFDGSAGVDSVGGGEDGGKFEL